MVRFSHKEEIDLDTLALYKAHLQEIGKLNSTLALLHWDQRTYLPPKGQEARAEVIGKLTKMVFELSIDDRLGRYLDELERRDDLSEEERASVRVVGKEYRRRKAIPPDFYERFAIASSKAESVWERAKAKSDFSLFRPHLEEMVEFARRFAEYYGYEESPYDALIEDYEPGMTSRELRAVIEPLRAELVPFIERLKEKGTPPETDFLRGTWPSEGQRTLSLRALRVIGYDFDAGRLDPTVHPFTISTGPNDVRVTTRFIEGDLLSGLFSSLHEGGHALYDQGIDNSFAGAVSMKGPPTGFTSRSRACGRTWSAAADRSGPSSNRSLPRSFQRLPSSLPTRSTEQRTSLNRRSSAWRRTRSPTTCTSCSASSSRRG